MVVPVAAAAARAAGAAGTANKARKASKSGKADRSGPASKGDVARLKRQASVSDDLSQQAYQAGQDGTPFNPQIFGDDQGARDAWQAGADERAAGARQDRIDTATGAARKVARPGGPGFVNDSAGWVLGLVVYALVLNYLQGGAAQARGWLGAKFINRPYAP